MNDRLPSDDFTFAAPDKPARRALRALQRGLYYSRADFLYAPFAKRRGVVILLYHSVPDPSVARFIDPGNRMSPASFSEQMNFIARRRRVLDLEQVLAVIEGRLQPEPGSVALTFDDGYRDNLTRVAPLLDSLRLPATLYLPTRLIGREESPWADRLYSAFRYRTRSRLELPELRPAPFDLGDLGQRRAAYSALTARLIESELEPREALLARVIDALAPSELPPRLLMSWAEAKELAGRYPRFRLGVHGAEHLDMTAQPAAVVEAELSTCAREFEAAIGEPALHFAYPYNRANEASRRAFAGQRLRSAMASGPRRMADASVDPLHIPRLDAPRDLGLLGHWTSGVYPELSEKMVGRS